MNAPLKPEPGRPAVSADATGAAAFDAAPRDDAVAHLDAAAPEVTVRLPAVLVDLFPGSRRRVVLAAATVDQMIRELDRLHPGMRDRLCDSTPAVRRHINIFIDGERASLDTRLRPGAEIFVLTAISGG